MSVPFQLKHFDITIIIKDYLIRQSNHENFYGGIGCQR